MFLEIANHLWQSTLFALFIGALCLLLRKDGAHIRYWLWWAASVKFLVPFSLLTAIGAWLSNRAPAALVPDTWTNTVTVVARPFAANAGSSPGAVLITVWAVGLFIVLGSFVVRAARLHGVLARAEQDPKLLVDGPRRISVYRTNARLEPGVVGIWRTRLLLPARI